MNIIKSCFEFVGFFLIGILIVSLMSALVFGPAFLVFYFSSVPITDFEPHEWFLFFCSGVWIWASGYQVGKNPGGY